MAVGDRIKRIRNLRGLTQKELGTAVGFDDKSADVRIAQYESGTRTPKVDMIERIAKALDVNLRSIYEPVLYAAEDVMFTLFELDEHHPIHLQEIVDESEPHDPKKHTSVFFDYLLLDEFLSEWMTRKQELESGEISSEEYMEWKINWPDTADDCGQHPPRKQWRKDT